MQVCDENHDEIVHDGRKCPLCVLMGEYADEITELQAKIIRLEGDDG